MNDPNAEGANPGMLIDRRYRIEAVIGRGGMSTVYRAHDESLGRTVALKILDAAAEDPEAVARERNEIALLATLNHPALVTLYDAKTIEIDGADRTLLVMEFVEGQDLADRLRTGPIAPVDAAEMLANLADALYAIHSRGIVHRDIKPGNVLLGPSHLPGREFSAKMADLGIAQLLDSARVTATGMVVGTAAYISPEQVSGRAAGTASDIYSLGLVMLEALTGERAFTGTMSESLVARLARDPEIPGSLGYQWKSLLTAMTAREPDARPSAFEVVTATAALPRDLEADTAALGVTQQMTSATEAIAATRVMPAKAPSPRRSRRAIGLAAVAAAVVLGAGAALAAALALPGSEQPGSQVTPTSVVQTSTPTVSTPTVTPTPTAPEVLPPGQEKKKEKGGGKGK